MAFEFTQRLPDGFHISVRDAGDAYAVDCWGVLDTPDACANLQPQLLLLHKAIVDQKIRKVRLNLQGVDYMNSGGLKSFMAWFITANQTQEHRYEIEVSYDPERSWQPISLRPMKRLAPAVILLTPPPPLP